MKLQSIKIIALLLTVIILGNCKSENQNVLKNYIDEIGIISTHEHQGFPYRPKHNCMDVALYLYADLVSAGMPQITDSMDAVHDPEDYWNHIEEYLRYCRATSYHAQFIANFHEMYRFNGSELSKDDFLELSAKVDSNFKNYADWLESGLEKCNIDYMLVDRVWDPFNPEMENKKFGYVFRFDNLVIGLSQAAKANEILDKEALKFINKTDYPLSTFDDYLTFVNQVFDELLKNNVIALKMGLAYHRSLDFNYVEYERAKALFIKQDFTREEQKELQDFLVFYIAEKAGRLNLPMQIHAGYLHGNRNDITRSQPMKLIPLLRHCRDTRFALFHGGFPWTGDFIALGKNYPNVYLDLVWLPQLSRTRAISALHEMLDAVPYNKIMWGGDVGKIDETAGSLKLGKEVVTTVLTERIEKGWMTEEVAKDIALHIFRKNAIILFKLDGYLN